MVFAEYLQSHIVVSPSNRAPDPKSHVWRGKLSIHRILHVRTFAAVKALLNLAVDDRADRADWPGCGKAPARDDRRVIRNFPVTGKIDVIFEFRTRHALPPAAEANLRPDQIASHCFQTRPHYGRRCQTAPDPTTYSGEAARWGFPVTVQIPARFRSPRPEMPLWISPQKGNPRAVASVLKGETAPTYRSPDQTSHPTSDDAARPAIVR